MKTVKRQNTTESKETGVKRRNDRKKCRSTKKLLYKCKEKVKENIYKISIKETPMVPLI